MEEWIAREYPKATGRHRRTLAFAFAATDVLMDDDGMPERFRWLMQGDHMRPELLAELHLLQRDGEMTDDDVRFVADHLCRTKPNVKRAVAAMRRQRLTTT